jgi:hypothetical protein
MQVSLACSGWTAHFRQYVVVPGNSQVFRAVQNGTLEELRRLFDEGLASPYSVDEVGWTLLHVGNALKCRKLPLLTSNKWAMLYRWDLVAPLVQIGLDDFFLRLSSSGLGSLTPYDLYLTGNDRIYDSGKDYAIHRLLLSHGVYDELQALALPRDEDKTAERLVPQMIRNNELLDSFLTHIFPNFYEWPLDIRVDMFCSYSRHVAMDPRAVARFFSPEGSLRSEHVGCRGRSTGITVFETLTSLYFQMDTDYRSRRSRPGVRTDAFLDQKWRDMRMLIREMASLTELSELSIPRAKAGHPLPSGRTLLVWGVLEWGRGKEDEGFLWLRYSERRRAWQRLLQVGVREWVEDIAAAGHDLEAYGKAEMRNFRRQDFSQSLVEPLKGVTGFSDGQYRWKGFKYGPRPQDWDLIWEWDPAVEEFVGDFWEWIENTPLSVPGGWVE